MKNVQRFRKLPQTILFIHVLSKLVFGIGLGVLLASKFQGYGWWFIVLAFLLSIPAKYEAVRIYRTIPTWMLISSIFATFIFGMGIGLLFVNNLASYGWWIIIGALVLALPGSYKILTGK